MKNGKKILAILAISALTFNYSFATGVVATGSVSVPASTGSIISASTGSVIPSTNITKIDGIDFLDNKTLSIKLSNTLTLISKDSEVKILEDLPVVISNKDLSNSKKVIVQLNSDLVEGSSYSLVSVGEGLDSSIDFNLSGDRTKILNSNFSKDDKNSIEYISVINPRTVEVYFGKDLTINTFEFKMFKELKVETMFLDTINLNVKMLDSLNSKKDYIAILSLKDNSSKDIEIENSLYDFSTPEFATTTTPTISPSTDLTPIDNSLTGEIDLSGTGLTGTGEKTEEVAMKVAQTPDTGTKTNILLLLTFILTLSIFILRRKSIKM